MNYQVIVGNIGTVYDGNSRRQAEKHYNEYVRQSKSEHGRAGCESVIMMANNEPIVEHIGTVGNDE